MIVYLITNTKNQKRYVGISPLGSASKISGLRVSRSPAPRASPTFLSSDAVAGICSFQHIGSKFLNGTRLVGVSARNSAKWEEE